jgi:hypothetical protein
VACSVARARAMRAAKDPREASREKRDYLTSQAGRECPERCECCGTLANGPRPLCWDHDHISGKFRGWICNGCNVALGMVGDSPYILLLLFDYLNRAKQS